MIFKQEFQTGCCNFTWTNENKNWVLEKLMLHIKNEHPDIDARIEEKGRDEARSLNGCGYYDGNKPSGDGWHNATPIFRHAWRLKALARELGYPEDI